MWSGSVTFVLRKVARVNVVRVLVVVVFCLTVIRWILPEPSAASSARGLRKSTKVATKQSAQPTGEAKRPLEGRNDGTKTPEGHNKGGKIVEPANQATETVEVPKEDAETQDEPDEDDDERGVAEAASTAKVKLPEGHNKGGKIREPANQATKTADVPDEDAETQDEPDEDNDERGVAEAASTATVKPGGKVSPGEFYRLRETKVSPFRQRAVVQPSALCLNTTSTIVLVNSHPSNRGRRDAVRDTWGAAVKSGAWPRGNGHWVPVRGLRLAFVVGQSKAHNAAVKREHTTHDDIIQGDFVDHYHNMTLKSLLGMKMVMEMCPNVDYFLKSDDDTLINLPLLFAYVKTKTLRRSIIGPHLKHRRAKRKGKWTLSGREFPFEFLPPYEGGSAYLMTADLVGELFNASEYVPHIFIDDLFITGILGRILRIRHVTGLPTTRDNTIGSPRASFAYSQSRIPNACDFAHNRIYTGTGMEPRRMRRIWRHLVSGSTCATSSYSGVVAKGNS